MPSLLQSLLSPDVDEQMAWQQQAFKDNIRRYNWPVASNRVVTG